MRLFLFLALFAMTINAPIAFADDNETQPLPTLEELISQEGEPATIPAETEETSIDKATEDDDEAEEQSAFASATDEQIAESQKFYKYCTQNDTMNKRKDCKCAATRFLEARMKYGSTTSRQKIILENLNTCLLDGVEKTPEVDVSNITQKQLDEANGVYKHCQSNARLRYRHDCECYASKYLEMRLEGGPMMASDIMRSNLHNQCRDYVKLAGTEYSECMIEPPATGLGNISQKQFCECFARDWIKRYEASAGQITNSVNMHLKIASKHKCKDPENYQ